jgi:hypothetical protein
MEAKIPSLEEWIQLSIQLNLPQLLEIKLHGGETPDLVPRLLAVLDRAGVTEAYTYHTLSRQIVDELKRLRPELVVGFIVPINFGGVPEVKADFLVIEQQSYSSRFIHQAWAAGFNVIVWTVNDEQQMRQYVNAAPRGSSRIGRISAPRRATTLPTTRAWRAGSQTRSNGPPQSEQARYRAELLKPFDKLRAHPVLRAHWLRAIPQVCGFTSGNKIVSRIPSPVRFITNRSMPMPIPPVGGMPYSRASRKSSSTCIASGSPAAARSD